MAFDEPACTPDTRRLHIAQLEAQPLDVLITGGGINGAGIARDLVLRAQARSAPLRIAVVEQRQFGSGTSGKNSQLIHGGLRYLKQLELRLVREALRERAVLLELAPHLVEPLPFLMPLHGLVARLYYLMGLWMYDMLAGRRRITRHRMLPASELARLEPELGAVPGLSGALFYDARVHSARFVLANIFDAVRNGAFAANYIQAGKPFREGSYFRVHLTDTLSGRRFSALARKVVNASGPWQESESLRLVRGSHLVLPRVGASDFAIAYFDQNDRIVFLIPWGSSKQLTLVGTTEVDHRNGPECVRVSREEALYLLEIVRKLFPSAAGIRPLAAFSSLRPLLRDESRSATATSREHRIWNASDGVLHVAGGKYTTYRAMSEEAADLVAREIAPELARIHPTAGTPLEGNSRARIYELLGAVEELAQKHHLTEPETAHLVRHYGIQSRALFRMLPAAPPPGLSRMEAAQIAYAVRHEMALRLPDLLFVSTYWGYERALDRTTLEPYAGEMGRLLGWDEARTAQEIGIVLRISELPELS